MQFPFSEVLKLLKPVEACLQNASSFCGSAWVSRQADMKQAYSPKTGTAHDSKSCRFAIALMWASDTTSLAGNRPVARH